MSAATSLIAPAPCLITRGCGWLRPTESLWAICHKLTYLNYMRLGDWQDLLFGGKRPYGLQGTSLLAWNHVPQGRLAEVLGIARGELDHATTEWLGLECNYGRGADWMADSLQYCPACLAQGFHSSLHQLRFIDRCPWHAQLLRQGCAHGAWISNDWSNANLARPFCCGHGEPLWAGLTADHWSPHSAMADPEFAVDLVTWLDSLRSVPRERDIFDVRGPINGHVPNWEIELEGRFRWRPSWHTQDAETVGFLAAITDGPAWLGRTAAAGSAGDIVRESCQVDPMLLTRIEAPRCPLRVPAIDSLPRESECILHGYFPDNDHPYCAIESLARDRFLAHLSEFQGNFAEHIARCPAEACVTDATPGGGCLLRRTTRGASELALSNEMSMTEWMARKRGEEVTVPARLRNAVRRVVVRQFEQALLWLGLAWRDLATVSDATLELLGWICAQAATALARNFVETILLDLTVAQSASEPAVPLGWRGERYPTSLLEQRRVHEFGLNSHSSPFALLSRAPGDVTFCAYHRVSTQQWSELARSGWLCDSLGRGPATPPQVTAALARLGVDIPRWTRV